MPVVHGPGFEKCCLFLIVGKAAGLPSRDPLIPYLFCWGEVSTSSHHGLLKHLCVTSVLSWARGCGCLAFDLSPTLAPDAVFLSVPGMNGALEHVRYFVSKSESTQEHV